MLTLAVDFDGTIVEHAYPKIGREIPFAISTLRKLQAEDGCRIILWTVRSGELLDEAVAYCRERGLEFYAVNAEFPEEDLINDGRRKIAADVYIDDRNVGGLPDWGVIYAALHDGLKPQWGGNYAPQPARRWWLFWK